jgi:autotransporter-associated beta strand protein
MTSVQADYKGTVLNDNPVAFYALDLTIDNSGTATDLTTNGNNSSYFNIYPVAGPTAYIANAATFSPGVLSEVDLSTGTNTGVLQFTGPTALEAWVQPADSTTFGDIIGKGYDSSTYQEIVLRENGGNGANYFGYFGNGGVSGGQQNTNWTHLVLSNDGTNTSLYVNGALAQSTPDTTGSINFSDPWAIGTGTSAGNSRYFNGNICQVAMYNHGLTASQVLTHFYSAELNASPANSAPIITVQPQPQATFIGGSATFSVSAVSALAMTNQWLKNGSPINGRTNATLTLNNVQLGDATNYSVIVGNINGTTNSSVVALSLFAPNNLLWSASGNTGVWDTGSSSNWINQSNSQQSVFNSGDRVLFDDTVGVPTTATVNGNVAPSLLTVNSSTNAFTINGSGTITGTGGLVKSGTSTLTVVSHGNFTGPVTINGGTIYAGNNCFSSVGSVTITNSSTLDFGGGTYNTAIFVSGTGMNGQGTLYNSYADYPLETLNITLAGDTTFGGSARWDLASGSSISGAHNLTLDWSGQGAGGYGEWNTPTIAANVSGITLTNGSKLGLKYMDTSFQNPGTTITVGTNGQAILWNGGFNGSLHILNGALLAVYSDGLLNGANITFENGTEWDDYGGGTDEPVNNAITLNGMVRIVIGDHNMVFTNLISGVGGFVSDAYNHQFVFSVSNTYAGPTVIGDGPQMALTGNGSISHSSLIFFGGTNSSSTHVDVSGRSDQTLTLASGQTLAGIGGINGSLVVSSGATVSPAGTNTTIGITTGSNPVGTIAAVNNVTLNGTTVIKLNGATNDVVQAAANIVYGGTLVLSNINGSPLAAGNSFPIFSAANYSGSFASIVPSTPGAGLQWDTNQLGIGVINVRSAGPVISNPHLSGTNFIFSGSGGSASGTYYVLTTTNVATPLTNWVPVMTNTYDTNGNFNVTNAIAPGVPKRFYRIAQ